MSSEYVIRIKRKIVDETYALHGPEAIDAMIDMVKQEIFDGIKAKGEPYYIELRQQIMKKMIEASEEEKQIERDIALETMKANMRNIEENE